MTSTGIGHDLPAVSVSGGFLWLPTGEAGLCAAQSDSEKTDPLAQEWARRLDALSVRAAWCVGEARRVAGIARPGARPNREGVCVSTGMGAQQTRVRYASRLVSHGLGGTNPIDFPDSIDGAPAAHVALRWNLQGPSFTALGAQGPLNALVIAARQLVLGTADRMHVVIGDVFELRIRAALADVYGGKNSPQSPEEGVLALVFERCQVPSCTKGGTLLVGFMEPPGQETAIRCRQRAAPICAAADPNLEDSNAPGLTAIADAWLGLTDPMGSSTIACQHARTLEGLRCFPLSNPQWPRLAFVRAEKR